MAMTVCPLDRLPDGRQASKFVLENDRGMHAELTDYGCRILRLLVPDRAGASGDVVLGHRTLGEYLGANYQGAFVGRYANRIGSARFSLNGETYDLAQNDGKNTLHGGPGGYHSVLFSAKVQDGNEPSVTFSYTSPDGEEGYPGELQIQVKYSLTEENTLRIDYSAQTDRETVFNPTNHSFFNLSGNYGRDVMDTELVIHADQVTEVTDDLIPTGKLLPVHGTPLDFTQAKALGADMFSDDHLIQLCGGFDHNFCVTGDGFREIARAWEPESGREMAVWSDMPGVQLYTFNSVAGLIGKDGQPMRPHTAFCLETQFYPDSVHHPEFPFTTVKPGKTFSSRTEYRFSVR